MKKPMPPKAGFAFTFHRTSPRPSSRIPKVRKKRMKTELMVTVKTKAMKKSPARINANCVVEYISQNSQGRWENGLPALSLSLTIGSLTPQSIFRSVSFHRMVRSACGA